MVGGFPQGVGCFQALLAICSKTMERREVAARRHLQEGTAGFMPHLSPSAFGLFARHTAEFAALPPGCR